MQMRIVQQSKRSRDKGFATFKRQAMIEFLRGIHEAEEWKIPHEIIVRRYEMCSSGACGECATWQDEGIESIEIHFASGVNRAQEKTLQQEEALYIDKNKGLADPR